MILKRTLLAWIIFQGWLGFLAMAQTPPTPAPAPPPASPWSTDLNAALKQAKTEKKMIIVEVAPDWNVSGKKLDAETFSDPKVQDQLKQAVLVKINPEASDEAKSLSDRMHVDTFPAILILNYKGIVLAKETGFQTADALGAFLDPYLTLFKSDPLGEAPPDPMVDEILKQALQAKPSPDDLPAGTLYYCLMDRCEITLQKDGSAHTITRRSLYMSNPDAARNGDEVSGVEVHYNAAREKVNFIYARFIDQLMRAYNLDSTYFHDKPAASAGDVSWDEHRLVAPSQRGRKGEIMDYETVRDSKPLIPGHYELGWSIQSSHLLEVAQKLIIHFPSDMDLRKASVKSDLSVTETKSPDGMTTWEIDSSSISKGLDSLFTANNAEGFRGYHFYTPTTWDDLAAWYNGLAAGHDKLPAEAVDLVAQTKKQNPDPKDQAFALYRWVVDNIRRYPVNFQESPLQAHPVDVTFHYRCGDIKDQTLLLISMLKEAGVPAYPVLTKKGFGNRLEEQTPMIQIFDHCLVVAKIDGKDVYFDVEAPETTVAGWLPVDDCNVEGLKVVDGKGELITTPAYQPRTDVGPTISEETALHTDGSGVCTARYTFRGATAQRMKVAFAALPPDKARETFAAVFKMKGDMTLTDFSTSSPSQKGDTFTLTCVATVPHFAVVGRGGLTFTLGEKSGTQVLSAMLSKPRAEPLRFYPDDPATDEYSVVLPPGMKIASKPDDFNLDTPFLAASMVSTVQDNKVEMLLSSATKDATIPVDRADEVKNAFQQREDHRQALFTVVSDGSVPIPAPQDSTPTPEPSPTPMPASASPPAPTQTPPSVD